MTRWALACSETFAFLMPKFLGYFVGVSLQTELLVINIFGLINSTLDWSYLRWNHQVEKIWNLSFAQHSYAPEGQVIYWIKSILSWVVIARIIIAHLYTFSYVANMYSILTWSRPRYLLPWITISFFKNIILEIIVLTLCFILWFEDKITTHLMVEFAIVKGVSLSVAFYNWWITCYGFLDIKRMQKSEMIRRFTLQQEFLHKTARLSRSFDDNYRFSMFRPHYHHHPSMPNLDDVLLSAPLDNDIDEVRFSVSLTTLLTNASWIPDDADLTPKERCMKALDITEADILKARKRVREPLSFLSLEIIDQMSIRLERDPDVEKDLIYFLVRDCKLELADELKREKRRLVPINEEESVSNKAVVEKEKAKITSSKVKEAKEETDDVHADVSKPEPQMSEDEIINVDMILEEEDDKDEDTEIKLAEEEEEEEEVDKTVERKKVRMEEKEEEEELHKSELSTVSSEHSSTTITEEKKEEKVLIEVELTVASSVDASLLHTEDEEKLLPKIDVPMISAANPCLPFRQAKKEENFMPKIEVPTIPTAHPCLPFTEVKTEEKFMAKIEVPTILPTHPCLPFTEVRTEEKLTARIDAPTIPVTHPCLPFMEAKIEEKLFPTVEASQVPETHPCLPFIEERKQQTCDPLQPGGKCLIKEIPNIPKIDHFMNNTMNAETVLSPEMFPCQCASPQGDRKEGEESVLNKSQPKNDGRTSETVAMANENFQSLLQAFKNAKGSGRLPTRNTATNDKMTYADSSGDSCNSTMLEPFLTDTGPISKFMQRPEPIPPPIPLHIGISSGTLYSGLAYGKVPKFSIAGGMWFHDHNTFMPRYFDTPLKNVLDGYEKMSLHNYQVYNTVHQVGLVNAAGILKTNPKTAEASDRQQIVRYLEEDRRDFVHSTQSFGLTNPDGSASTSANVENVSRFNLMYLRSSDAQTESWSRVNATNSSRSIAILSNARSKDIGTQTNSSLIWNVSRTVHDVAETKREVWSREGNRYREDAANNGGTRIVSRNSVGNFHQANRIHSQSTSKSARCSSQSRFSAKTSPMSVTHSRISLADESRQSMILKRYLRDTVTQTQASALHDYLTKRHDQGHWRRLEKPRPGSWGTVTLAQTAHRSGYQAPILQGKPPAYPKFVHEQESRSFASSSNDWRMMKSAVSRTSSFGKRPVSVRDKRSVERQSVHSLQWSRSRKYTESENSESREIRALKAYNKFTLLEDKREMDAKRRDFILTSRKEKVASSVYRIQNDSSNESSLGENSIKNLELKAPADNRSLHPEKTPGNAEDNKNGSEILKSLNVKDIAMILELFDHYGAKRLREELKKMLEANQADFKKQYASQRSEKDTEKLTQSAVSCRSLEGAGKGHNLEKVRAKQDVKEDLATRTAVNRSQLQETTDDISVDSVTSSVKANEDSVSSISNSLTNPRDNDEETVQKSSTGFVSRESRPESSKGEETPVDVDIGLADEQEVEIVPAALSSSTPKESSSTLENKADATASLETHPYHRIVVVESESTNSMESIRSDGETWVLEERLDERLLGNAFQLGSRQANVMNLFDIVRGIGLDFHSPRVVTNAQMQGRSVNLNDLRKSTQVHIVDDTTASLLHNAFYFKSEIIVRTIQDASSFGSDSQTDSDDVYSGMNEGFVHRLRTRPDFVCYTSGSDIDELGFQHLGNQHSSQDDEEESTFNLCLILDQDDLSEATEQSSATLGAESIHRQTEYRNSLDNVPSLRFDVQFVEQLQRSSDHLTITELNKSADSERDAAEVELRSHDDLHSSIINSSIEPLRQKIWREFFLENEEYINRLNFPIKCNILDIIPALEDQYKRNWQVEPFSKIPKCCVVTANAHDSFSKDESCEEASKMEMISIDASQLNKYASTSASPTIFTPSISQNQFFENLHIPDDVFPPDCDIPQSSSATQVETSGKILTNTNARTDDEEKTIRLERKESSHPKDTDIDPEPSKVLEPRPSNKQFPFAIDEPELLPLNIIFAFCQLMLLLYIQFFLTTLFTNEKASKSTITSGPYEFHSVYTSTTRLFDPPSVNSRIYRKSSSRQTMKLTSAKSISMINENDDALPPENEYFLRIIEPLSTTETFPEVTRKEIASIIEDVVSEVIKCMECPQESSPIASQTRNAERHSSVFFEPQKSFYLLDADTDILSRQIITAGNQLPKQKPDKKSESASEDRFQGQSSASSTAANAALDKESSDCDIEKQPVNITSSGFQYVDSFNSTFTVADKSCQSEATLGERTPMEEFSRESSVASESQSTNEQSDEQTEEETQEPSKEQTES